MSIFMIVHVETAEITGMTVSTHQVPVLIFSDYSSEMDGRHVNLRGLYVIRKT